MLSKDGSLKSSFDSLDEPTGSIISKQHIPMPTSARLKKKGEEIKKGISP
jgi:hypothetical protein